MLQYEVKADTHASLVIGWLLTIRRNHRRSASCFAGLALSPAWTVDIKQALRMGAAGYGVAAFSFFVVQATPRKTEEGTEDLHAAVGNSAFRRRHNYLV